MKKIFLCIAMLIIILVIAVIDILGIMGILMQDVVIPFLFPLILLMFCLFVLILKGVKTHEDRDR